MSDGQLAFERNLIHNTLHQGRLTFAVLSHKRHLFPAVDGQVHIVEHHVVTVCFLHILANHRIVAGTDGRREFQSKGGIVFFVNFDGHDFFQLLDAALHLYSLRGLVTEAFNEIFRVFYLFLLVFVRTQLLLAALLTQHDKFIVGYFVVVNPSAGNLNGAVRHVVDEGPVVAHQHHSPRTCFQKVLQPLDTLNVQVVGRLVEQEHIRTTQQKFRQLNTHAPSSTELRCRPVKIAPVESQPRQRTFNLCMVVGTSHHQETFVLVGKALYQFVITLRIIIRTVGQLLVHLLQLLLHLEDMLKSHLGFCHHRTCIA